MITEFEVSYYDLQSTTSLNINIDQSASRMHVSTSSHSYGNVHSFEISIFGVTPNEIDNLIEALKNAKIKMIGGQNDNRT